MSPERLAEISSAGGKAAHAAGTAHTWTKKEAQEAGRKGGKTSGKGRKRDAESVNTSEQPVNTNKGATK